MESAQRTGFWTQVLAVREIGILIVLVLLTVVVSLRTPSFLTLNNLRDILLDISILSILAIGQATVIITRNFDLSVASTLALSGMLVGMTVRDHPGTPAPLALALGALIGIAAGSLNGLIVTRGHVPSIIATLGTLSIYRGLVFAVNGGGWINADQMSESFKNLARGTVVGLPYLVLAAAVVALIFYYFLNQTRTGRNIYAVGSNPQAAQVMGVPVARTIFLAFLLSGMLAGLGGVLWVSRYASAQSDTAVGFELQTVAAAVVGGVNVFGGSGTIPGVLLGALLLGVINNALTLVHISPFWQLAVQGLVILVAVVVDALISQQLRHSAAVRRAV
jgi:rhamnose transport system permease protein